MPGGQAHRPLRQGSPDPRVRRRRRGPAQAGRTSSRSMAPQPVFAIGAGDGATRLGAAFVAEGTGGTAIATIGTQVMVVADVLASEDLKSTSR